MRDDNVTREAFEHWYSNAGKYPEAVERSGDNYKLLQANGAWQAWQAAWLASILANNTELERLARLGQ
jgi:arsenate reductase-like glutaredoxin family protein